MTAPTSLAWTCTVNGAAAIGPVEIDRELDADCIATYYAATRPTLGSAVAITGTITEAYSGVVDRVEYDLGRRAWRVQATDGLRAHMDALAAADIEAGDPGYESILALLPAGAYWNQQLFGPFSTGWEACEDALSTVPYSIRMLAGTPTTYAWAGTDAGTAITHADGDIYMDSAGASDTPLTGRVNEIVATFTCRYTRLHHWSAEFGWALPDWDFCEWYAEPHSLPTREMIADAANSNVWDLESSSTGLTVGGDGLGIATEGLPESGTYTCGIWSLPEGMQELNIISAGWTAGRRWAQTIVETYTLTVSATGAPGITETDEASVEYALDDAGWDAGRAITIPSGTGWQGGGIHTWLDGVDTTERDALIEAFLGILATRIRRTQRGSYRSARVLPGTEPVVGARATITSEIETCAGQVVRTVSRYDPDSGDAGCEVTVVCSDGVVTGDALTAPDAPDVTPTAAGYTLDGSITFGTHIGGQTGATVQDEDWDGWVGNYQEEVRDEGAEVYQEGFVVVTPDVPDTARDDQEGTTSESYTITALGQEPDLL